MKRWGRSRTGYRKCPECQGEIREEAIKCKHCGEFMEQASSDQKEACWLCRVVLVVVILLLGVAAFILQSGHMGLR
jgi:predicted nucleic acid-binding Zn ribbon protein